VPWEQISTQDRETFLRTYEGEPPREDAAWIATAANVDLVLSAARFLASAGEAPAVDVADPPVSAAGAYWRALLTAHAAGDAAGRRAALLALADLGLRVDRYDAADGIYATLALDAEARGDLAQKSLALLGRGRVAERRGDHDAAMVDLGAALAARRVLGDKPYLLEIYNEIGNLAVHRGELAEAAEHYRAAERLAEDLDDTYLRAVLGNNLGILALLGGDTARADALFTRAWDVLGQLSEAEGRSAAALNLTSVGALGGDPERARAYLAEARRILGTTAAPGRLGSLHAGEGYAAGVTGDAATAARHLLRAWAIFERLGRRAAALRLRNNVAAADFLAFAEDAARGDQRTPQQAQAVTCLRQSYRDILESGYSVYAESFERWRAGPMESVMPTMAAQPWRGPPRHSVQFLMTELNAEAVAGLRP
jgi:tetratricopeptide (TPR) repeat protein